MKPHLILLYPLLWVYHFAQAQVLEKPMGAETNAMGGIATTQVTGFDLWNNPALMANKQEKTLSLFQQLPYFQKSLQMSVISAQGAFPAISMGMGIIQSGNDYFNQQVISLGFAKKLSKHLYLGSAWHYQFTHQYQLPSFGNLMGSIGIFVQLNEKLGFGTYLFNLNQAAYSLERLEKQGTLIRFGMRYQAMENLIVLSETEKTYQQKEQWKLGIQYGINDHFFLLAGWNNYPQMQSFGIRHKSNNKSWMVGTQFHRDLGFTPLVGFQVNLKKGL